MFRKTTTKFVSFFILTGLLALYTYTSAQFKQDIVEALENINPEYTYVFKNSLGKQISTNKIFIKGIANQDILPLQNYLLKLGYKITPFISLPKEIWKFSFQMIPFLDKDIIPSAIEQFNEDQYAKSLIENIYLPGTESIIQQKIHDPLNITEKILKKIFTVTDPSGNIKPVQNDILVFAREGDINFKNIENIEVFLENHPNKPIWTGGDFFALENYKVVQKDIMICTVVSIVSSIIIFWLIAPYFRLIAFLVLGTGLSYIFSLAAVQIFHGFIYSIVLTFTSTFIGFNNEYLIHFSGIEKHEKANAWKGLGSAIGTTFIGFAVLLFSEAVLVKQIGIASLGAMVGFLLFLYAFKKQIQTIKFKTITIPSVNISTPLLILICTVTCVGIFLLPKTNIKTDLNNFRYASERLDLNTTILSQGLNQLPVGKYAIETSNDGLLKTYLNQTKNSKQFHPLNFWKSEREQLININSTKKIYEDFIKKLQQNILKKNIPVKLTSDLELTHQSIQQYLSHWQVYGLGTWSISKNQSNYLILSEKPSVEFLPISPKSFYENILNHLQQQFVYIFAVGLLMMFLYLLPWQIKISKVIYIFTPLLLSFFVFKLFLIYWHKEINLVHLVGFSLVIAVAIDYSSILVSSNYNEKDLSKVTLTGLIAFATFGSLLFAQHPLIWDLGFSVVVGVIVSLVFCLGVRLKV